LYHRIPPTFSSAGSCYSDRRLSRILTNAEQVQAEIFRIHGTRGNEREKKRERGTVTVRKLLTFLLSVEG
jgi:hypothetical protein